MSTRSSIGVLNADGTVTAVYCHYDGYPGHHAPILTGAYGTEERARALLALGSLRVLGPRLSPDTECAMADDAAERLGGPVAQEACSAFHRDRGESWDTCAPETFADLSSFEASASHDYTYLFRDGAWFGRSWSGPWSPADKMAEVDP